MLARRQSLPCPVRARGPLPGHRASPDRRGSATAGFTLVELLVVIVVISVLLALVAVGVSAVRAVAQRTVCLNNLHELGLSAQLYVSARDTYPPAWTNSTCRWMDLLKPNVSKSCDVYRCPSDSQQIPCTYDSNITLSYGINCFLFADQAHCFWYTVNSYDVAHPNQVILLADCTPGNYWCGGGSSFSDPVTGVDYRHMNGTFNAVYCDGHAETKTTSTQTDWDASQ